MRKATFKILAGAGANGDVAAVRKLGQQANNLGAHAIVLLGSLTSRKADPKAYGEVLKALAEANSRSSIFASTKSRRAFFANS